MYCDDDKNTQYDNDSDDYNQDLSYQSKPKINFKIVAFIFLSIILVVLLFFYFQKNHNPSTVTIDLKSDEMHLKVGEEKNIVYEVIGEQKNIVSFSSSDENVVIVDNNGKLIAQKGGEAYIFMIITINGNKMGKICHVYVEDDNKLNNDGKPTCSLNVRGDGTIVAKVSNASKYGFTENFSNGNELEYKFSFKKVIGVTRLSNTPIYFFVENNDGVKGKCSVIIEVTCEDLNKECTYKGIE